MIGKSNELSKIHFKLSWLEIGLICTGQLNWSVCDILKDFVRHATEFVWRFERSAKIII